jgi:hypothetical protein
MLLKIVLEFWINPKEARDMFKGKMMISIEIMAILQVQPCGVMHEFSLVTTPLVASKLK